jgi:hypothetical protein
MIFVKVDEALCSEPSHFLHIPPFMYKEGRQSTAMNSSRPMHPSQVHLVLLSPSQSESGRDKPSSLHVMHGVYGFRGTCMIFKTSRIDLDDLLDQSYTTQRMWTDGQLSVTFRFVFPFKSEDSRREK